MPAQTPIYGFIYPCPGEVISPMDFQVLANQIDAKLLELQADYNLMINRKNMRTEISAPQTIAAGVDTVLTSAVVTWVVPMSGLWIVHASAPTVGLAGTVNMQRLRVRQNGVVRFGQTQNTEANTVMLNNAVGPINATAGDTITLQWLFNGTGTEDVGAQIDAKMLVRTA